MEKLKYAHRVKNIGNKSLNLYKVKNLGLNVAPGIILTEKDLLGIDNLDLSSIYYKNSAVRSSAVGEDGLNNSFAGIFTSILGVKQKDLKESIKTVYESFFSRRSEVYQNLKKVKITPQILIQNMVDTKVSAVAFVKNDYIEVNWFRGSCENIVSGKVNTNELIIDRGHFLNEYPEDSKMDKFVFLLEKLYSHFQYDLDVELAFNGKEWYVLQVRKLS